MPSTQDGASLGACRRSTRGGMSRCRRVGALVFAPVHPCSSPAQRWPLAPLRLVPALSLEYAESLLSDPVACPTAALMDLALWKRPQASGSVLGAATVVFYVFQYLRYTALSLLAHILLAAVAGFFLWTSWCRFKSRCGPAAGPGRRRASYLRSALSVRPACHLAGPRPRCPSWRCRRPKCERWWPRRLTRPTSCWPSSTSWAPDKTPSRRRRCVAVGGARAGRSRLGGGPAGVPWQTTTGSPAFLGHHRRAPPSTWCPRLAAGSHSLR